MINIAITGVTGFLGSNLLCEIIKNNFDNLGNINIICFGRGNRDRNLISRIKSMLISHGYHYFMPYPDEKIITEICSRIVTVEIDFSENIDRDIPFNIAYKEIDAFFHLAAVTDLRDNKKVKDILYANNFEGTRNIFAYILKHNIRINTFVYVSTAYACGKTYENVLPDYRNSNQDFRNPYEYFKLKSELDCVEFCKRMQISLKIYRPSIIVGRTMENPIGHISKYDTIFSWIGFFMKYKKEHLNIDNPKELLESTINVAMRVWFNPEGRLNLIPVDYAAKIIYKTTFLDNNINAYHIVCSKGINNVDLFHAMCDTLKIKGIEFTSQKPSQLNYLEKLYDRSIGKVLEPYIMQPTINFVYDATEKACNELNIGVINTGEKLDAILKSPIENYFTHYQIEKN